MSHTLIVDSGKHKGRKLKISRNNAIIGRDESAVIRIASQEVSRRHCVLIPTPEGLVVRDLESSNGTFVNGTPILRDTILQPGDVLKVGPMSFRLPGRPAAPPVPPLAPDDPDLSDDEIATWLTDPEGESSEISSSDTTIIPETTTSPVQPIPPRRKKEFRTVAEEAADIIRRHFESLDAGANDKAADN